MTTLTRNRISSLDDGTSCFDRVFAEQDSIATETVIPVNPAWDICIDSLLKTRNNLSENTLKTEETPNFVAIDNALIWIAKLKKQFPDSPPTFVTSEPSGGIIVERRGTVRGKNVLCELTFYNNGCSERTDYLDGRVVSLSKI